MLFNDSYATRDGSIGCHAAGPDAYDTPAVLVLHEIFGVNANIRKTVDRLGKMGYRAVAPDLFWRQRPGIDLDPDVLEDREEASTLLQRYLADFSLAIDDLHDAVAHLRKHHRKVAVLGYCLGGKMAFVSWLTCDVDAVVSFYGVGLAALTPQVHRQRTPLLMHLGKEDPLNPPETVDAIRAALSGLDNARIHSYDDVGHAFARLGAASYVAKAAEQADSETFAFLNTHLQD
jgi:carboxymethylenebutenolidase